MEYQKIVNLLDDASNQPSKFKTKNSVEINDESKTEADLGLLQHLRWNA